MIDRYCAGYGHEAEVAGQQLCFRDGVAVIPLGTAALIERDAQCCFVDPVRV